MLSLRHGNNLFEGNLTYEPKFFRFSISTDGSVSIEC